MVVPPSHKSREKIPQSFRAAPNPSHRAWDSLKVLLVVVYRCGVGFGLPEGTLAKFLGSALWSKTLHVLVLLPTLEEFEMTGFGGEETFGGWSEAGAVLLFCF